MQQEQIPSQVFSLPSPKSRRRVYQECFWLCIVIYLAITIIQEAFGVFPYTWATAWRASAGMALSVGINWATLWLYFATTDWVRSWSRKLS